MLSKECLIFTSIITGASESVGKHMLEACNNNLEMAVTMFLDGGGIAEEPSTSSAGVSAVRPHTEYVPGEPVCKNDYSVLKI